VSQRVLVPIKYHENIGMIRSNVVPGGVVLKRRLSDFFDAFKKLFRLHMLAEGMALPPALSVLQLR
jgi:hypothetical protein